MHPIKLRFSLPLLALLAAGSACKFAELPPIAEDAPMADAGVADAAAPVDAAAIDAIPTDAPVVQYTLTIVVDPAGTGDGTVQVEPGGFTCVSGTCSRAFDAGTDLTITITGATSLDGATISGDCSASPCVLPGLAGNRSMTVRFEQHACVPSTESCVAGAYTRCGSDGNFVAYQVPNLGGIGVPGTLVMDEYVCPMGCSTTQPRCADIDPQNALTAALDSAEVSPDGLDIVLPAVGAPSGTLTIDENQYDSAAGEVRFNDTNGAIVRIPAQLVSQPGGGPVLVLKTRTFSLRAGSSIVFDGNAAIAVLSHFDMVIAGRLDLSAIMDTGPVVGEGPGALGTTNGCAGQFLDGASGGGSNGCSAGNASTGAARGALLSTPPALIVGGCPGGHNPNAFGFAAGGGGALLLASRTRVTLAAGALVDVSGAGGPGGMNMAYGGGSGGRVVLESPSLLIQSGAVIAGRGGSGGAGGPTTGVFGNEGPTSGTEPAVGPTCTGCGTGGRGGYEGACGSNGVGSDTALGGGGGGTGRVNAFTRTGTTSAPAGTMKINLHPFVLPPRSL